MSRRNIQHSTFNAQRLTWIFHRLCGAIRLLLLTPCFSGVFSRRTRFETVSTVSIERETVETVIRSMIASNTPLKQGVNERRRSVAQITREISGLTETARAAVRFLSVECWALNVECFQLVGEKFP